MKIILKPRGKFRSGFNYPSNLIYTYLINDQIDHGHYIANKANK